MYYDFEVVIPEVQGKVFTKKRDLQLMSCTNTARNTSVKKVRHSKESHHWQGLLVESFHDASK